jgi:DNA-binding transcriptional LysR family regulator
VLNLHQLQIFAAVVEQQSVTRAAQQLHLTQPAVSGQLRALRAYANAPLLVRDGRRVVPTEEGAALYHYARQVLGATESLDHDLAEIASGGVGRAAVAGNRAYAAYVLPGVLTRFQLAHPSVTVRLLDGPSAEVVDHVAHGEIDVAVVTHNQIPTELKVGHLGDDVLVTVESAQRPVSHGGRLTLEQAARAPFVRTLIGRDPVGGKLDHLLVAAGLEPRRVVMESNTWEGIKEAVRAGIGIAIAFHAVVARELANGEFRAVTIEGYEETRPVDLICAPQRLRGRASPVFRELISCLQAEVPPALYNPRLRRA